MTCIKLTPFPSMMVNIAAIAALIGEPDIATWEATTDPASVREGRIPDSFATSA